MLTAQRLTELVTLIAGKSPRGYTLLSGQLVDRE